MLSVVINSILKYLFASKYALEENLATPCKTWNSQTESALFGNPFEITHTSFALEAWLFVLTVVNEDCTERPKETAKRVFDFLLPNPSQDELMAEEYERRDLDILQRVAELIAGCWRMR